jgi:2-polyprenyl-3-methyl-5-hydroxy-6-metoxy-1,4-benzoquinol methylase
MHRTLRKVLRTLAGYDPDYYDMRADAGEAVFAQIYLERILAHARERGLLPGDGGARRTVLDAGCQAGRLLVPLAQQGFAVTGIDTSGFALRRARRHLQAAGVSAELIRGDVARVLAARRRTFDLVICTEVVYLTPQYREVLDALARAVRPGGLLCVSHRPRAYYFTEALRAADPVTAGAVLRRAEGPFRDSRYYNWQTEPELRALYASRGLRVAGLYPVDRLAWLSGADVSRFNADVRRQWLEWELQMVDNAMHARYVLVIAEQPEPSTE